MSSFVSDLCHAARSSLKRPGFTLMVVLVLSLGIGGTTAVFSIVNGVLLRPMSFRDAEQLVVMWESDNARNQPLVEVSFPDFRDWQEQNTVFDSLAAICRTSKVPIRFDIWWFEPRRTP